MSTFITLEHRYHLQRLNEQDYREKVAYCDSGKSGIMQGSLFKAQEFPREHAAHTFMILLHEANKRTKSVTIHFVSSMYEM